MAGVANELVPILNYPPIGSFQIRILQRYPGKERDALSGELITTNLNESTTIEYDALSYMWGDPTPTNTIWLSGKPLPIASNLNYALMQLRCETTLVIWIDAVCIDQKNNAELAEQVQLMRRLYRGARLVRIFINEPGFEESSEAVVALQNYPQDDIGRDAEDPDTMLNRLEEIPAFGIQYCLSSVTPTRDVLGMKKPQHFSSAFQKPMKPLRSRIQQEVLNASAFNLYCGKIVIPGRSLANFKQAAFLLHGLAVESLRETRLQAWLKTCGMISCKGPVQDLTSNQHRSRYLYDLLSSTVACSKPQDHVYAIMHLTVDYEERGILVDYSKSGYEVAVDAAAYLIRIYYKVEFLKDAYLKLPGLYCRRKRRRPDEVTWLPRSWCGYREP